jgi:hypothetical protein
LFVSQIGSPPNFAQAGLRLQFSYLHLPRGWDYRPASLCPAFVHCFLKLYILHSYCSSKLRTLIILEYISYSSGSQSIVPGPIASVLLENMLEMTVLWPHAKFTVSELLGVGQSNQHFNKSSECHRWMLKFGNNWSMAG